MLTGKRQRKRESKNAEEEMKSRVKGFACTGYAVVGPLVVCQLFQSQKANLGYGSQVSDP